MATPPFTAAVRHRAATLGTPGPRSPVTPTHFRGSIESFTAPMTAKPSDQWASPSNRATRTPRRASSARNATVSTDSAKPIAP